MTSFLTEYDDFLCNFSVNSLHSRLLNKNLIFDVLNFFIDVLHIWTEFLGMDLGMDWFLVNNQVIWMVHYRYRSTQLCVLVLKCAKLFRKHIWFQKAKSIQQLLFVAHKQDPNDYREHLWRCTTNTVENVESRATLSNTCSF